MTYLARRAEPLSASELAVYQDLPEPLARLLFIRGVDTKEKLEQFTDFSLDRLHDPFKLKGMLEAVNRINTAIAKRERILIIGDYDCDGICAAAILYKYLLHRRAKTSYFLPNRDADGYGLSVELIDKLNERFSPNLIITVDCGVSCPVEIAHAKSLKIDVIVTDHHAIPEVLPSCIIVNPKLPDQEYPFNGLCGAGVSLKLVQALDQDRYRSYERGLDNAERYLDICAIATVADIVPLIDENRVIVQQGLEKISFGDNPAITALAKSCNVYGEMRAGDISYKLGPKINAAGRMGNAKRGLDLLLEKDQGRINEIIESLSELNVERQKICANICDQAEKIIAEQNLNQNNVIILHQDDWEGGVLGIVAARIAEKYLKPAIVLSRSENIYKGSARSVGEINIVKVLEKHSDLLVTFGGHSMAGGLSVNADVFPKFVETITNYLNENICSSEESQYYDFDIDPDDITIDFVEKLRMLDPVGCDNPAPSFMTTYGQMKVSPTSNYPNHLRLTTKNSHGNLISFIFFNGLPYSEILASACKKRVLFEFQKQDTPQENNAFPPSIKGVVKAVIPIIDCEHSRMMAVELCLEHNEKLSVDREVFVQYYRLLQALHGKRVSGLCDMYQMLEKEESVDPYQLAFCVSVFKQLGILTLQNGYVKINTKINTDLEQSSIYRGEKLKWQKT